MIRDLILKNRSYRKFVENEPIGLSTLHSWIELARFSASGMNMQPIKYFVSNEASMNQKIFECLSWANYLTNWDGPVEGERPSAYIIQLLDTSISKNFFCDDGIAAQSILLGAVEMGYGGCIFRSINKPKLKSNISIPDRFEIINVIALGKPAETVVIDDMKDNDHKYWRDSMEVHHVPKRLLSELIVQFK